jgi:hypothetical protein
VRVIPVVFVRLPDEPVTVILTVPIAAVLDAVSVSVLVLAVVPGLKEPVTPLGRPDTDNVVFPLKPFSGVTVIVLVAPDPCVSVTLLGDAETEKFGPEAGQLFAKLAALMLPIPVAKSHPVLVPYAGLKALLEVESTPSEPPAK